MINREEKQALEDILDELAFWAWANEEFMINPRELTEWVRQKREEIAR